ncbi:AMP-binding protein [Acetobacter indonesiensis]
MLETLLQRLRGTKIYGSAFESASRSWSWSGFLADVRKTAHALESIKQSNPTVVGIRCADYYHHWVLIFALDRLGLASASFQNDYGSSFKTYLAVVKPDLILADLPLEAGIPNFIVNKKWFLDILSQKDDSAKQYDSPGFCRIGVAAGTDVKPHKIGLTRGDIEQNIQQLITSNIFSLSEKSDRPDLSVICCIGIDILAGYQIVLAALATGYPVKIIDRTQIALAVAQHKPIVLVFSPLHLEYILSSLSPVSMPQETIEIIVVGGRLPVELETKTKAKLTKKIHILYGTEEAGVIAVKKSGHLSDPKSAGSILPWMNVEIVDESDTVLPLKTEGRVRVSGNTVIKSYLDTELGANNHFKNGWFYPGDIGFLNDKNEIFITGRTDSLASFGGDKFDLRLLDQICKTYPGIQDACTFSVPDDNGVLTPWAAIVCHVELDGAALGAKLHEKYENLPPVTLIWVDRIPYRSDGEPDRDFLTNGILRSRQK